MFGITIRRTDDNCLVVEPDETAEHEREWYVMNREGYLVLMVHTAFVDRRRRS